jgi:hypothetical protein
MSKRFSALYLCAFVLCNFIMLGDVQANVATTYNGDYINTAYQKAYGRDATADEVRYWDRLDVRNKFKGGDCWESDSACINHNRVVAQNKLVIQLKKAFSTPGGGQELKATIDRSYMAAFNRLPSPQELAYWQTECKSRTWGYEELIPAHKKWEQTNVKPNERLAMINKVYPEVYGRAAKQKEIDYWMTEIPKKGIIYDQLCNYLKDWISGNSREQIEELEGVIRRAYAKASVSSGPNPEQMKAAMNYVTSKRPFFGEFVNWVKKENTLKVQVAPPAGTTPVKVPSFKR